MIVIKSFASYVPLCQVLKVCIPDAVQVHRRHRWSQNETQYQQINWLISPIARLIIIYSFDAPVSVLDFKMLSAVPISKTSIQIASDGHIHCKIGVIVYKHWPDTRVFITRTVELWNWWNTVNKILIY